MRLHQNPVRTWRHPSLEEPDQDETEDGPPRAQGPQLNVWRCLRCDSGRWTRNLYGTYLCMSCEGTEFYSCRQPHRRVTEDGVWMFMPRPAAAPAATDQDDQDSPPGPPKALSRRQRRRQRQEQQKAGGPPGPPSEPDTYSENPESETLTFDPTVEPEPVEPAAARTPARTCALPLRLPPSDLPERHDRRHHPWHLQLDRPSPRPPPSPTIEQQLPLCTWGPRALPRGSPRWDRRRG